MGIMRYKSIIKEKLAGKPHLEPIYDDVCGVVAYLRDVDSSFFVVRNHRRNCFEVHSYENKGNTFCMMVKYPKLDYRTVLDIKYSYAPLRAEAVFKELEEDERKREADNDKQRSEKVKELAERLYKPVKKMAWEGC